MGAGWIIIMLAAVIVIIHSDQASALTRDEINLIEDQIRDAEKNIILWDEKIKEQRQIITEKENSVTDLKETLRQIKDKLNDSWTAYLDVENAEKNLQTAERELTAEQRKLTTLINERSNFFKFIRENKILPEAEPVRPASQVKLLGIQLSKSCEMIQDCLSYNDLLFLDSSDQRISGKLITENGITKRGPSPYLNSWRAYDNDNSTRIVIDPPKGMADKIKMINIHYNFGVYFKAGDYTINNQTRTWSEGRYIDNCTTAYVNSDLKLLQDTITYMQSGCTITEYQEDKSEITPLSNIDLTTSPNWQAEQKLKQDKIKCKGLCFEY